MENFVPLGLIILVEEHFYHLSVYPIYDSDISGYFLKRLKRSRDRSWFIFIDKHFCCSGAWDENHILREEGNIRDCL